jgi:gluconolactonase
VIEPADLRILARGLDHPEGVAVGPDGVLWAGGEAGQIYRIDPGGGHEQVASTGGSVLGLCLDGAGLLYACDWELGAVVRFDPASGSIDTFCDAAAGVPLICPNWLAFAPDGALIVSDSGTEDERASDGRMLRVPPGGGEAEVFDLGPLRFPNGFAIDDDGLVFLVESFGRPRLCVIGARGLELVAELPGTVPDGVALTADGRIVVSSYNPFRIDVVTRDGRVEPVWHDTLGIYTPMPTNVAFFGDGLASLAVASFGGYTISALDPPFAGAPLRYP